jgi:5-methylcytosine-specific restriction endonuclease McrA
MKINALVTAAVLSDADLLARLGVLAGNEREASAELVAHLAVLDTRPGAYAAQGYGSLFGYCTQALRLSEDAACNRIGAARACRRFPAILDRLASGALSLTTVRLLSRHLTPENHESVLARAEGRRRHEIDVLVAELSPQPDVPPSVRRLPSVTTGMPALLPPWSLPIPTDSSGSVVAAPEPVTPNPSAQPPRPIVRATAPNRYRVQFTVDEETHEKLRRLQALLRREIPDGDPGAIFGRALTLLLDSVEKSKLGALAGPKPVESIRPGTDKVHKSESRTRHIPRPVRRAAWRRDQGQCAFVSQSGQRCVERTFLEFHHVKPYAAHGPASVENISLRCRRHNQYEAELLFGPRVAAETPPSALPAPPACERRTRRSLPARPPACR